MFESSLHDIYKIQQHTVYFCMCKYIRIKYKAIHERARDTLSTLVRTEIDYTAVFVCL